MARALHEAIDVGLDDLVEHGGGGGGERGAEQRVQKAAPRQAGAGGHAKTDEGGDEDEETEARLGEDHEVAHEARHDCRPDVFVGGRERQEDFSGGSAHAMERGSTDETGERDAAAVRRTGGDGARATAKAASSAAPFKTWKVVKVGGLVCRMTNTPSVS